MRILTAAALAIASSGFASTASAQSYAIPWHTIDGGGGTSTGGIYTVRGTIGQHDASASLSGGIYTLKPGFWGGINAQPPCPADMNNDGIVDFGDISVFIGFFTVQDLTADFNGDGIVDFGDISVFIDLFTGGC